MKAGWQKKKLHEICELINGRAYSKSELLLAGKYPVLRVGNFFTNDHWYHSNLELEEKKYCDKGDLLYAWSASFGPRIWTGEKVIFHYHIWKVDLDPTLIDKMYLFYFFEWDVVKVKEDHGTGTTMMHVSKGSMEQRDILLPPLAEQKRIVSILDEAFEGIAIAKANAVQNQTNSKRLYESFLDIRFNQESNDSKKMTLAQATGGISTGPFGSLLHKKDYVENGIPLVNPAHISDSGIEPDFRKSVSKETARRLSSYLLMAGDIVIGRRGEMGRCALVTESENGWICGTGSFIIRSSPQCNAGYLVRLLRSNSCKQRLEEIAGGAVMPNLSNTDLGNFEIQLPTIKQQNLIIEEIDEMAIETDRLDNVYSRKLMALDELKKSLLHKAFAGKL